MRTAQSAMSTDPAPSEARGIFKQAVQAAKTGNRDAARDLFAEVTRLEPTISQAWMWRAYLVDSPETRADFLKRALELDPTNERVRKSLKRALAEAGIASAKRGARAVAKQQLLEATRLDPSLEIAWLWLASIANDPNEKLRFVERVLATNPRNERAISWQASLRQQQEAAHRPDRLVLIVDDSMTVRSIVGRTLKRHGYRTATAASCGEASEFLAQTTPDVIFLDVDLPDRDGFELCREIKESHRTRSIPVIMLTGKDGIVNKYHGQMVGAQAYITKPFQSEDLLRTLHRLGK